MPSSSSIDLAIREELRELMARGAKEVVFDVSDPFTAVTALDGASNPVVC
jgi:hypothetical protein